MLRSYINMVRKFIIFIICYIVFVNWWFRFKWNFLNNNKYILFFFKCIKVDFIIFRILVIKIDEFIRIKIISLVIFCFRMLRNLGCFFGVEYFDFSFRLLIWVMERIVVVINYGRFMMEYILSMIVIINRFRWYL